MNIGLAFLFMLSAASPAKAVDETINMVQNPSFEFKYTLGTDGRTPLYWSRFTGDPDSFCISSWGKQGDTSFKLVDDSETAAAGLWTDPIPVTAGRVYTARAWGSRNAATMNSKMYIKFFDTNDNCIYTVPSTPVGSVSSWSEGTKTATAPLNSEYARILLYSDNASTGYVYLDCVSLTLADERIHDGDFGAAAAGGLPDHWSVYSTHAGAVQDCQSDGGSMRLRLYDASSSASCGAVYRVPASAGVPYKLSALARKADGGSAMMYLKFYRADHTLIGNHSTYTTSAAYTNLTLAATAPAGTVYAKVLCYINSSSSGTAYFDDVSFTEDYEEFYAGTSAAGTGLGDTEGNRALYTDASLWSLVDAAAELHPAKVTLLPGSYTQHWVLSGVGNSTNRVLIAGETPFAADYCDTSSTSEFLWVYDCENVTLQHLHFSAEEDPQDIAAAEALADAKEDSSIVYDYNYVLRIGNQSGIVTTNIRCEGVTFTGMLLLHYGATGAHKPGTSDITWDSCAWTRIGYDAYDHCVYNADDSSALVVTNCYFQDCNGTYIRFRNRSEGTVANCDFLSTGTQPNASPWGHLHHPFIQLAAVNPDGYGRDEMLGTDFTFSNNTYTYENTSFVGKRCPFSIKVGETAPVSNPTLFLVPPADGAKIKDVNHSLAERLQLMQYYFGIDMQNDIEISGVDAGTFAGCWDMLFTLSCHPDDGIHWDQELWVDEWRNCDISALSGL